jgi:hypothetical protein
MKTYRGGDIASACLTSALDGGEWSALLPGHYILGKIASGTHWIRSSEGSRVDDDAMEKRNSLTLQGMELQH